MKKGVVITGIIVVIAIGIGVSLAMSYNNESLNEEVILSEEATIDEQTTIDTGEPGEEGGKNYTVTLEETISIKEP